MPTQAAEYSPRAPARSARARPRPRTRLLRTARRGSRMHSFPLCAISIDELEVRRFFVTRATSRRAVLSTSFARHAERLDYGSTRPRDRARAAYRQCCGALLAALKTPDTSLIALDARTAWSPRAPAGEGWHSCRTAPPLHACAGHRRLPLAALRRLVCRIAPHGPPIFRGALVLYRVLARSPRDVHTSGPIR